MKYFPFFLFVAFFAVVRADEGMEESMEPSPEATPACFPADAMVSVPGGLRRIADLRIGDKVLAADGLATEVMMFTHNDAKHQGSFVELITPDTSLQLTDGHYIYTNGQLAPAGTVKRGDMLTLADGTMSEVTAVRTATNSGLYNPQTASGDIVINGVVASTYTTFIEPSTAHTLLAPVRAFFSLTGITVSA